MTEPTSQRLHLCRLAGGTLLVSVFFWWTALQAWATAQYGYFAVDVIGATPLLWVLLIALAGVTLLTGVLPRRAANLAATLAVVLAAIAPAVPNSEGSLTRFLVSSGLCHQDGSVCARRGWPCSAEGSSAD